MAINPTITGYDNFFLANEIEDQYNSHLNLMRFVTVNNSLVGRPGMKYMVNVYKATDGVEKLTKGQGNTKGIGASFTTKEYEILLAQGNVPYYDEDEMTDPIAVQTAIRHLSTDMFNVVNADIFAEFNKTEQVVTASTPDFGAFVDVAAAFNVENVENMRIFGFVNPADKAKVRKALKDDLKYVEAYARTGYIGTVAGIDIYDKADATEGTLVFGTKEAVTVFNKKGVEVERITRANRSFDDANVRKNAIFARKYYVAALTDATKAVKLTLGA